MDVKPMPGLEQLPFAEVWFHEIDDDSFRAASAAALALGKTGLEAWTTDRSPAVVAFLADRGYGEVRRYVIAELDVASAAAPDAPAFEVVSLAERPELAKAVYAIACESYPDQPGRGEQQMPPFSAWRRWGLDPHPAEAYLIALESGEPVGYGYLELDAGRGTHGFMGICPLSPRSWRGELTQARPDRLGEGARPPHLADRHRGETRPDARPECTSRLSADLRGDRASRTRGCKVSTANPSLSGVPVYSLSTWASSRSSCSLQLWHC